MIGQLVLRKQYCNKSSIPLQMYSLIHRYSTKTTVKSLVTKSLSVTSAAAKQPRTFSIYARTSVSSL